MHYAYCSSFFLKNSSWKFNINSFINESLNNFMDVAVKGYGLIIITKIIRYHSVEETMKA